MCYPLCCCRSLSCQRNYFCGWTASPQPLLHNPQFSKGQFFAKVTGWKCPFPASRRDGAEWMEGGEEKKAAFLQRNGISLLLSDTFVGSGKVRGSAENLWLFKILTVCHQRARLGVLKSWSGFYCPTFEVLSVSLRQKFNVLWNFLEIFTSVAAMWGQQTNWNCCLLLLCFLCCSWIPSHCFPGNGSGVVNMDFFGTFQEPSCPGSFCFGGILVCSLAATLIFYWKKGIKAVTAGWVDFSLPGMGRAENNSCLLLSMRWV